MVLTAVTTEVNKSWFPLLNIFSEAKYHLDGWINPTSIMRIRCEMKTKRYRRPGAGRVPNVARFLNFLVCSTSQRQSFWYFWSVPFIFHVTEVPAVVKRPPRSMLLQSLVLRNRAGWPYSSAQQDQNEEIGSTQLNGDNSNTHKTVQTTISHRIFSCSLKAILLKCILVAATVLVTLFPVYLTWGGL